MIFVISAIFVCALIIQMKWKLDEIVPISLVIASSILGLQAGDLQTFIPFVISGCVGIALISRSSLIPNMLGIIFLICGWIFQSQFSYISWAFFILAWVILLGLFPFGGWLIEVGERSGPSIVLIIHAGWRLFILKGALSFLKPSISAEILSRTSFVLTAIFIGTIIVGAFGLWKSNSIKKSFSYLSYALGGNLLLLIIASINKDISNSDLIICSLSTGLSLCGLFALLELNISKVSFRLLSTLFMLAAAGLPPTFGFVSRIDLFHLLSGLKTPYPIFFGAVGSAVLIAGVARSIFSDTIEEIKVEEEKICPLAVTITCAVSQIALFIFPSIIAVV